MEVLSLVGDITQAGEQPDGKAKGHAHAVIGLADGSTRGGRPSSSPVSFSQSWEEETIVGSASHSRCG